MKNITWDTESGNIIIPTEIAKRIPKLMDKLIQTSNEYIRTRSQWLAGSAPEFLEASKSICAISGSAWMLQDAADELKTYVDSGMGCTAEDCRILLLKLDAVLEVIWSGLPEDETWLECARKLYNAETKGIRYDYSLLNSRINKKYGSVDAFEKALKLESGSIQSAIDAERGLDQAEINLLCDALKIDVSQLNEAFFTPLHDSDESGDESHGRKAES